MLAREVKDPPIKHQLQRRQVLPLLVKVSELLFKQVGGRNFLKAHTEQPAGKAHSRLHGSVRLAGFAIRARR